MTINDIKDICVVGGKHGASDIAPLCHPWIQNHLHRRHPGYIKEG
ncbi:MAG: hypothetical protein ABSH06_21160 [Thermodesulfobacteriota bacterium]